MQPDSPLMILPAFLWLALVIAASIFYRRRVGKPIFPRAPANALFAEKRCSGNSRRSILTQIGGASNCLLIYVADRTLHIVPQFPFNLMFEVDPVDRTVWRLG